MLVNKKTGLFFLFFLLNTWAIFAQNEKYKNKLTVNTSIPFALKGYLIPPETTIHLNFELKNKFDFDTTYIIEIGKQELVKLYEIIDNELILLTETGAQIPIPKRSIIKDGDALKLKLKGLESKNLSLTIHNFLKTDRLIKPNIISEVNYQLAVAKKGETFYHKYWNTIYFGILILVLLFTIVQYYLIPEKFFIYYFFYIFLTLIRSAAYVEFIVLENWFPFLSQIGYSSPNSQVFTYTSLIFYVLFLRNFTNFKVKKPHLDYFFKIQLGYLVVFIIFDLIFPSQKYNNNQIYTIFRMLELAGLVLGVINLFLLFKVYDLFNKYVIIGAVSLFLIAMVGQEIIKRNLNANFNESEYRLLLTMVWTIAYLVEIGFFTLALISRQRNLLDAMENERKQNIKLKAQLETQKTETDPIVTANFDQFTLATNKGVFVYQQSDIVRLEASGNYTIFTIKNNKQTLASYTLSDFEPKLNPSKFLRVHKSHFVNLQYVTKYTKGDGGTITMEDGTEIPVSRSRKDELLKRLHTN